MYFPQISCVNVHFLPALPGYGFWTFRVFLLLLAAFKLHWLSAFMTAFLGRWARGNIFHLKHTWKRCPDVFSLHPEVRPVHHLCEQRRDILPTNCNHTVGTAVGSSLPHTHDLNSHQLSSHSLTRYHLRSLLSVLFPNTHIQAQTDL